MLPIEESRAPGPDAHEGASRRRFIQAAGAVGAATVLAPLIASRRASAAPKKSLKILQWNHFVPGYDKWFDATYVKEWGAKNDTEVIVDHVGIPALATRAAAEVSAQKGHDLFMFLSPPPAYEEQVIDHRELYEECTRKHGKPVDLAVRSTYNPKTKKYFAFSDSYVPDPINYRKDLWDDVGMTPNTWDDIRVGGRKIKQRHNIPLGIGLEHVMDCYTIWKFADNIEGARKFLVDYIDNFHSGFMASEFYNFPCFSSTVPDLQKLIANDSKAKPADKYKVLSDVLDWATNIGYPGYANAAIDEIFNTWVLNMMFAKAASGADTPENAIKQAEAQCKRIVEKWRGKGLV